MDIFYSSARHNDFFLVTRFEISPNLVARHLSNEQRFLVLWRLPATSEPKSNLFVESPRQIASRGPSAATKDRDGFWKRCKSVQFFLRHQALTRGWVPVEKLVKESHAVFVRIFHIDPNPSELLPVFL